MDFIEKCVLYKLDKYREVANRDRFVLPDNQDVSLFTKVIDLFVDTFNDVNPEVDPEIYQEKNENEHEIDELESEEETKDSKDDEEENEHKTDEFESEETLDSKKDEDEENNEIEINEEEETNNEPEIQKSLSSSNYDVDLLDLEIKRNDPIDFDQFIIDFCDLGENLYEIQTDLRCGFKIWSRCELDSVQKQFDEYMNQKFQDTRIFLDNQRRHVYKGIKLKPLKYKKTNMNFDFEEFIYKKCEINHLYRISYNDFFHYFILWKKETDPLFELKRPDSVKIKEIKEILELSFAKARIQHSVNSKTKNLWGLLGIGMIENNFGQIDRKRQNKKVGEFDLSTNNLLKEYDSIYCASQIVKIPFSTFGNYIRTRTVVKGKYYKLL